MPVDLSQFKDGEEVPSMLSSDTNSTASGPDLSKVPDGQVIPFAAPQLRQLIASDPYFPISFEAAKTLYKDDQEKGILGRMGEAIEAIPEGVSQLGKQVAEAHEQASQIPFPTSRQEVERLSNTITESAAEGALNTIGMARRAWNRVGDWAAENLAGQTEDERIQAYLERLQFKQQMERQARGLPEEKPANYDPAQPSFVLKNFGNSPPYEKVAQVFSLPLDPAFIATSGVGGLLAKGAGAALRSSELGARALDALEAVKSLPTKTLQTGLGAAERTGAIVKNVAGFPGAKAAELAETFLPEEAAAKFKHALESAGVAGTVAGFTHGGVLGHAIAAAKVAQGAGLTLEEAAGFAKRVAELEPSAVPRLLRLARDDSAPAWMRSLSIGLHRSGIGTAAGLAADLSAGALHGGAVGAGLSAVAGDEPEEIGRAAGAGLGLGALGRAFAKSVGSDARARAIIENNSDLANLYTHAKEQGISDEALSKLQTDPAIALARLSSAQARAMFGKQLNFKYLTGPEYDAKVPAEGRGTAAYFDKLGDGTPTIAVNLDAPGDKILHEIGHAVSDAVGADGETRLRIDATLTPEQISQAGLDYATRLTRQRLKAEGVDVGATYSRDMAKRVGETIQALNEKAGGDGWIYGELYAEATWGALQGKDLVRDIAAPSTRRKIAEIGNQARSKILSIIGGNIDPDTGAKATSGGALFSNPKIYQSPELRKLVASHLNRIYREGPTRSAVLKETKEGLPQPTDVPKRMVGQNKAVPAQQVVENGLYVREADGTLTPAGPKIFRAAEKEKREEGQKVFAEQPTKPRNDTSPEVAPRIDAQGQTQITGTRISDQLATMRSYGPHAQEVAKAIESVIGSGDAISFAYHAIGHGYPWAKSVRRNLGNIPASFVTLAPYEFSVSKAGNVLVTGVSITAADRKIAKWRTAGKMDLWGGDAAAFRADLMTYLKNHAEGKSGAEGIGEKKRDVLNLFVAGKVAKLADLNPLRAAALGEDRSGIVRSLRLDRIATVENSPETGWNAEWIKKKLNFSPNEEVGQVSYSPKVDREDRDPYTGVSTMMRGENLDFDSVREAIHAKAVSQTVRESLADAYRLTYPEDRRSKKELSEDFAKSTNDTPQKRNISAIMQLLVRMPTDELRKALNPGSRIEKITNRLRAAIPLLGDDTPIVRAVSQTKVKGPFEIVGQGNEGVVVGVPGDPYVYKIFKSTSQPFALTGVQGVRDRLRLNVSPGTAFDSIIRLERQARFETGLPTEIAGINRRGDLVVKMPRMSAKAEPEDVSHWIDAQNGALEKTFGNRGILPDVTRNQPIIQDRHGNYYAVADVRRENGAFPNLLKDRNNRVLMSDLMILPITARDATTNPLLRGYAPRSPENILFSPAPESGEGAPATELKAERDPVVGVPSFFHGNPTDYEAERAVIKERAVSKAARNAVAVGLKQYFPDLTPSKSPEEIDQWLALTPTDFLGTAFARPGSKITLPLARGMVAAEVTKALKMTPAEFRAWSKDQSTFQKAVAALRDKLPLIKPDAPILRAAARLAPPSMFEPGAKTPPPRFGRFERLGAGGEAVVIGVKGNPGWVYKLTGGQINPNSQPFTLSGIRAEDDKHILSVSPADTLDLLTRFDRVSRLPDGLPAEILGIGPGGELVLKMPRMTGPASMEDVEKFLAERGLRFENTAGDIDPRLWADPALARNQPFSKDQHGNTYALVDVRNGEHTPNIMQDVEGKVLLADVAARPITDEDVKASKGLRPYAPKAPNQILYSPAVDGGQPEGTASPDTNPSVQHDLTALRAAARFRKRCDQIDEGNNIESRSAAGLVDSSEGQEDGVFRTYLSAPSQEILHVVGARYGLAGDENAVLTFTVEKDGPATIYKFTLPSSFGGLDVVRQYLDDKGIEFRTLLPRKDGIDVVTVANDNKLGDAMTQIAAEQARDVEKYRGNAEVIGAGSRGEAREKFYEVIRQARRKNS